MGSVGTGIGKRAVALALGLISCAAALAGPAAGAEGPQTLWTRCGGSEGDIACNIPRGIGVSQSKSAPNAGDLYMADSENHRIVEYSARGEFRRAFGWGVLDGSEEPQVCAVASACQVGLNGAGAGEFGTFSPQSVAVDSEGDVYVGDRGNNRVQKFDPEGHFLLTFGGEVNRTKEGEGASEEGKLNLCPVDPGDECQAGKTGAGEGKFERWPVSSNIAAAPDGRIYVGDKERIQIFEADGSYATSIPLAGKGYVAELAATPGTPVGLYAGFASSSVALMAKEDVFKLNTNGAVQCTISKHEYVGIVEGEPTTIESKMKTPTAVATDAAGHVYVFDATGSQLEERRPEVFEFDSGCGPLGTPFAGGEVSTSTGLATGSACFSEPSAAADLYLASPSDSFVRAYGPAPDDEEACPPPPKAPEIDAQYALSVGTQTASVGAEINPKGAGDVTFSARYATADCLGEPEDWSAGCVAEVPLSPASLQSEGVDHAVKSPALALRGLTPDTEYRLRFSAQSSGGGPVSGLGGTPGEDGTAASFHTFAFPPGPPNPDPCPNAAYRTGAGAFLPDCRAYEMVSPIDKGGSDVLPYFTPTNRPAELSQSAVSGEALAYSTSRSFGDAQSNPYAQQLIARREGGEWSSHSISPPRGIPEDLLGANDTEFKAFSADLCEGWLVHDTTTAPPLAAGAPAGFKDLYRRDNCGAVGYEALSTVAPPEQRPIDFKLELEAISGDGATAVFGANDAVGIGGEPGRRQVYASAGGGAEPRMVCVLPSGAGSSSQCSAGSTGSATLDDTRSRSVNGALSQDGSRLYWSDSGNKPGRIYLRENPTAAQSALNGEGRCSEPARACTVAVSAATAVFWGASRDGARALFTAGAPGSDAVGSFDLYEYDAEAGPEGEARKIAGEIAGVVGASEDLSRVYLISAEALGGGSEAVPGQPNLYLREAGGATSYVATLASADAWARPINRPSPVSIEPYKHAARVSPDGGAVIFNSDAGLTGHDSTDAASGEADSEVYRYQAGGSLACISCNPSGARPQGSGVSEAWRRSSGVSPPFWGAAFITGAENQLYAPRNLSDDGQRIFFDSFDPLVPRDTNSAEDVYQWEAPGKGGCTATSPSYSPPNGGCLDLISSGKSPRDSEFLDASPSGEDVFMRTGSSLVPSDPGQFDVYDARVGGGLASQNPPPPPPPCEGDACQNAPGAPEEQTPGSATFHGPRDPKGSPCARHGRRAQRLARHARRARHGARRTAHPRRAQRMRRRAHRLAKRAQRASRAAHRCRARRNRRAGR